MQDDSWKEVTSPYQKGQGEERWLRKVDDTCYVSVLHRTTGFGFMEWESAIVHSVPLAGNQPPDREVLIIAGDRRYEFENLNKEELIEWYSNNIEGNRNTLDTLINKLDLLDND